MGLKHEKFWNYIIFQDKTQPLVGYRSGFLYETYLKLMKLTSGGPALRRLPLQMQHVQLDLGRDDRGGLHDRDGPK